MRSVREDLTARAKIRDAAVLLFGRTGFDRTSVRSVAEAAGVSPGLVLHHFGSKDGLRAECDAHVVDLLVTQKSQLDADGAVALLQRWLADLDQFRPLTDYLTRMLSENSPGADRLFDALLDGTRQMLAEQVGSGLMTPPSDPEATAAVLTAYGVVPLLLERQLGRALGTDGLEPTLIRRLTVPLLELYSHGLYADDRMLEAAREALARTPGPSSGKGEGDPTQDPDPPDRAS
nr:TetR family transcriptional regulator [uncultured Friedmanniella sp.]